MKNKIKELIDKKSFFYYLSEFNIETVRKRGSKIILEDFKKFCEKRGFPRLSIESGMLGLLILSRDFKKN